MAENTETKRKERGRFSDLIEQEKSDRGIVPLIGDFLSGIQPTINGRFNVASIPTAIQGMVHGPSRREIMRRGRAPQRAMDLGQRSQQQGIAAQNMANQLSQMQLGEMRDLQSRGVPISAPGQSEAQRENAMEMLKTQLTAMFADPQVMALLQSSMVDERSRAAMRALLKGILPKNMAEGDVDEFLTGLLGGMGVGGGAAADIDTGAESAVAATSGGETAMGNLMDVAGYLGGGVGNALATPFRALWNKVPDLNISQGGQSPMGNVPLSNAAGVPSQMTPEQKQQMQQFIKPNPPATVQEVQELIRQLRSGGL